MVKERCCALLVALVLVGAPARTDAQSSTSPMPLLERRVPAVVSQSLFSPSIASRFAEIAHELTRSDDTTALDAEQAMLLLLAAGRLDKDADYVQPALLRLATKYSALDRSRQIIASLEQYVSESADLEIVRDAIRYLLEQGDSHEERETLLKDLAARLRQKNPVVDSQLATLLGLMALERADLDRGKYHLIHAYASNKYNKVAFTKLTELLPDQITPATYMEHLRLVLREDPLSLDAALDFARYAERLELYSVAGGAYQYCAELFAYLYPSQPIPPNIYLPWAVSCYNTKRGRHICMQIADAIRRSGRFDILLEAIAGRAAAKTGGEEEAQRIFTAAERQAEQLLLKGPGGLRFSPLPGSADASKQVGPKQFAWFYCLANPQPDKALDWANKAFSTEPNSPAATALLAYALVMNNQIEWAKTVVDSQQPVQIADLARARILLHQGLQTEAIETLKASIAKDPGSLAAEKAKQLLSENGSDYVAPVDPDLVIRALSGPFGENLVPRFIPPDQIMSIQFNIRGNKFSYGTRIAAVIAIENRSSEPLVVTDNGMFKGRLRIDARVSGDLEADIPNLVWRELRNQQLLERGRSLITSVNLSQGELARMLSTYPQASLKIEFVLYIDPVTTPEGLVSNRLVDVKPVRAVVYRPGLELTGTYLRNRFNSISTGQIGQKTKTAELFVGLLKEIYAMKEHGVLYELRYKDWMPDLLKSALIHQSGLLLNPSDEEWTVKVHTMAEMLSMKLDHELTGVIAKNLDARHWPVRLMAIYLLSQNPDGQFQKVLDWVAEYDQDTLVRQMALALGAVASSGGPDRTTPGK